MLGESGDFRIATDSDKAITPQSRHWMSQQEALARTGVQTALTKARTWHPFQNHESDLLVDVWGVSEVVTVFVSLGSLA